MNIEIEAENQEKAERTIKLIKTALDNAWQSTRKENLQNEYKEIQYDANWQIKNED